MTWIEAIEVGKYHRGRDEPDGPGHHAADATSRSAKIAVCPMRAGSTPSASSSASRNAPSSASLIAPACSSADTIAAACGSAGALLFLRSSALRAWKVEERSAPRLLGPLGEPGFLPLIGVVLLFSMAFGLLEIGVTAYATERASPALAGLLLGLMSVGSALGGLAYGSRSWRFRLVPQFSVLLALMGTGLALLSIPSAPLAFAALGFFAGVVMAPVLIVQSMLVTKSVRPEHTAEAFTWSASALLAGVGIGLGGGGLMLEICRSNAALAAAAASALLAALVAAVALKGR